MALPTAIFDWSSVLQSVDISSWNWLYWWLFIVYELCWFCCSWLACRCDPDWLFLGVNGEFVAACWMLPEKRSQPEVGSFDSHLASHCKTLLSHNGWIFYCLVQSANLKKGNRITIIETQMHLPLAWLASAIRTNASDTFRRWLFGVIQNPGRPGVESSCSNWTILISL